ncbi:class 1 isoprenoid biosynthesis enzyme [Actinacidiphila rubida]|uniref:Polyprenyl synthetase n=1 Tax=Actinacidiphila rubida TaxID=310780 RepID=A0A1H8T7Q5_9ACTN|nr:class 1 isoprenoid biosynthesis enzyme [Actinacidiphila rubida]SEO86962.1 hypothetical protein SAMN05216267_104913 [Actinacidiphila rubida]
MGQRIAELGALLRCLGMSRGLPAAAAIAYRSMPELGAAYDRVAAPLVDECLAGSGEHAHVVASLRPAALKFGLAVLGYAALVDRRPPLEAVVLAGAVTRLYDDLIDGGSDPSADDRLADLLGNRRFTPATPVETLLGRLVRGIERRLHHPPDAALLDALVTLHEFQVLSRRQREPDVPTDVLEKIIRGKGAAANLVLCGVVKSPLAPAERELAMDLGEALQSLDDCMDVECDRANGVTTLASRGVVTLDGVARRLLELRADMVRCHGRRASAPYCGMLFFLLLKTWAARRLPALGRLARGPARRSAALAFLSRADDALPPAPPETAR